MSDNASRLPSFVEEAAPEDKIKKAWQAIVLNRRPTDIPVRNDILKSWQKCLQLGVDPRRIVSEETHQQLFRGDTGLSAQSHGLR